MIEVRTNKTGSQLVGICNYKVQLSAPNGVTVQTGATTTVRWLHQLPVQFCAIQGSAVAAGGGPASVVPATQALTALAKVNDEIWYPQAQIAFSVADNQRILVIADPSPPVEDSGEVGDVNLYPTGEAKKAADACSSAWARRSPNRPGTPIVIARAFPNDGQTLGVALGPPAQLQVASHQFGSGKRGDALCGYPVQLESQDLVKPWLMVSDYAWEKSNIAATIAHELGHNLYLGHGNGLDDNGDGLSNGLPGPRRYDEFCDPGWLAPPSNTDVTEDLNSPTRCSLMQSFSCSTALRPLQVETARGVAKYLPGFLDGTRRQVIAAPTG